MCVEYTGPMVCKGRVYVWSLVMSLIVRMLMEMMESEKGNALLVMALTLYVTIASVYSIHCLH